MIVMSPRLLSLLGLTCDTRVWRLSIVSVHFLDMYEDKSMESSHSCEGPGDQWVMMSDSCRRKKWLEAVDDA